MKDAREKQGGQGRDRAAYQRQIGPAQCRYQELFKINKKRQTDPKGKKAGNVEMGSL